MNPIKETSSQQENMYPNQSLVVRKEFKLKKAQRDLLLKAFSLQSPFFPFFAGAVAGFGESTAFYWTVTWKNCCQQSKPLPSSIRGFYKGFSLNALCMMMFFSIMNGVNDFVKKEQKQIQALTGESVLVKFAPAIFGGIAASIVLNPVEVTTIQRLENKDKSLMVAAKKIYQKMGWKGFYKGFLWALSRNIPYSLGINVVGPKTKHWMEDHFTTTFGDYTSTISTVGGVGTAGLFAGFITQSIDNIKTQVQRGKFSRGSHAFKALYQEGGFKRLFAGGVPRNVRTAGGSVVAVGILGGLQKLSQYSQS